MGFGTANRNALFQLTLATLLSKLFISLAPGFELCISCVGSDCTANSATVPLPYFKSLLCVSKMISIVTDSLVPLLPPASVVLLCRSLCKNFGVKS